jgi:hypothetical protein
MRTKVTAEGNTLIYKDKLVPVERLELPTL